MQKLFDEFREAYKNKNYLKLSLYLLLSLLTLVISVILTYYIASGIYSFIAMRFEALIAILGAYLMIYLWWQDRKSKKEEQEKNILLQTAAAQQSAEEALCLSNYDTIQECLLKVLPEIAEFNNLIKPQSAGDITSKCKIILKGNVYMCQYAVLRKGDVISKNLKDSLQFKIDQKLRSRELPGIGQVKYIYQGQAYSILCVDEIRVVDSFVLIDMAFASDAYCEILNCRLRGRIENLQSQNINFQDRDF